MNLYQLSVSQLTYLETGQFIIRFITDFESKNLDPASDAEFKTLYDSLKLQSPVYDAALMQIRAKAETELLTSLDYIRDKKVTTLRRALEVYKFTDVATEKTAYGLLKILFKVYKNIETESFEAESLAIDNLIIELRNTTHLPAMQLLGIAIHVDNLETANNNFKTTFNTRSTATINTTVYDTKKLTKKYSIWEDMVMHKFV